MKCYEVQIFLEILEEQTRQHIGWYSNETRAIRAVIAECLDELKTEIDTFPYDWDGSIEHGEDGEIRVWAKDGLSYDFYLDDCAIIAEEPVYFAKHRGYLWMFQESSNDVPLEDWELVPAEHVRTIKWLIEQETGL
jgi:hypothetical protein